jgi:hypothetical protein
MSINIKLSGGLGNQLFQYALGRSLATQHSCTLNIDTSWYRKTPKGSTPRVPLIDHLNIKANFTESVSAHENLIEQKHWFKFFSKKIYMEKKYFKYDESIIKLKPPIYLDGYWQSYKYFENIRHCLLNEITPKVVGAPNYIHLETLIKKTKNPIAIHVRRGDYVTSESASKVHGLLGINYYKKAINAIMQKTETQTFFFFSDEINWVKENLGNHKNFYYIEPSYNEESAIQELYLMSLCSDFIIANSTFSWWGAWLGTSKNKIVIYPEKWMANLNSLNTDLMPNEWIAFR